MSVLFLTAALIAVVSQLAVLRSVVIGRAPGSSSRPSARWVEVAWVLLPTVALIAVLWLTWNRIGAPIAVAPTAGIPA